MRLAFLGTPEFAAVALKALLRAGHEIACVYSQPPRPAHRGKQLARSAVHLLAEAEGLPVRTPVTLRDAAEQSAFAALDLDAAVAAAYGLILPAAVLAAPRRGCLNIHASLLPRWRGAAPIHRAIMAGDVTTGISIMQMDAGLDTGPVLLRQSLPIRADDTTATLHDRLAALGAELIVEALASLDRLVAEPQPAAGITYAQKISKNEAQLDFSQPADVLERTVRALNPFPGAFVTVRGERIKILRAEIMQGMAGADVGHILDAQFRIQCADGTVLHPSLLQRPGRQPVSRDDFLRGFAVTPGEAVT